MSETIDSDIESFENVGLELCTVNESWLPDGVRVCVVVVVVVVDESGAKLRVDVAISL